jgi:hypothetical protein
VSDRATVLHEAGHCIGFIWAGLVPREVRVDAPEEGLLGTTMAPPIDADDLDLGHLIAVVLGPMASGSPPPRWKPRRDADDSDEVAAAALVEHLGLAENDYRAAIAIAGHLLDDPRFKTAHALLCAALARVPVLDARQLRELLGPRLEDFELEGS